MRHCHLVLAPCDCICKCLDRSQASLLCCCLALSFFSGLRQTRPSFLVLHTQTQHKNNCCCVHLSVPVMARCMMLVHTNPRLCRRSTHECAQDVFHIHMRGSCATYLLQTSPLIGLGIVLPALFNELKRHIKLGQLKSCPCSTKVCLQATAGPTASSLHLLLRHVIQCQRRCSIQVLATHTV